MRALRGQAIVRAVRFEPPQPGIEQRGDARGGIATGEFGVQERQFDRFDTCGMRGPQRCLQLRAIDMVVAGAHVQQRAVEACVVMQAYQPVGIRDRTHHAVEHRSRQVAQRTVAAAQEIDDGVACAQLRIRLRIVARDRQQGPQRGDGIGFGLCAPDVGRLRIEQRQHAFEHAGKSAELWRKISLYVLIPGAVVLGAYMYKIESEHHAHHEHILEENDGQLPERPDYEYVNMKSRNFPWGQQSLFFNPKVNYPAPEM